MIRIDVKVEKHGNYILWKPGEWVTVCLYVYPVVDLAQTQVY